MPSVIEPTAKVAAEEEVPIPDEEEEGRVEDVLLPHLLYIPEETEEPLPSRFDIVDDPSL